MTKRIKLRRNLQSTSNPEPVTQDREAQRVPESPPQSVRSRARQYADRPILTAHGAAITYAPPDGPIQTARVGLGELAYGITMGDNVYGALVVGYTEEVPGFIARMNDRSVQRTAAEIVLGSRALSPVYHAIFTQDEYADLDRYLRDRDATRPGAAGPSPSSADQTIQRTYRSSGMNYRADGGIHPPRSPVEGMTWQRGAETFLYREGNWTTITVRGEHQPSPPAQPEERGPHVMVKMLIISGAFAGIFGIAGAVSRITNGWVAAAFAVVMIVIFLAAIGHAWTEEK